MIEIQELTKIYSLGEKQQTVLKNINLYVRQGESVVITGRSGSGKSTLLYQIGLLDRFTSGTLIIAGKNIKTMNDKERTYFRLNNLGFIFQDYGLVPSLTAIENVMLPLLMTGTAQSAAVIRAAATLEKVDLKDKGAYHPNQLSGGQQQRVSIARAIVHNPKIIIADEPTANLDSKSATVIFNILKILNDEGHTVIVVTHERKYIKYANHRISLSDGKIIRDKLDHKTKPTPV